MPRSKRRTRTCQWCDKSYELGIESNLHKYCSTDCRQQWHYDRWKSNGGRRCPKKLREYQLQHNYGLSLDDFNRLLESQNNRCAICLKDSPGGKNWHVDHCHQTGEVRGVLCQKCNQAIGMFYEDLEILDRAKEYIKKHEPKQS